MNHDHKKGYINLDKLQKMSHNCVGILFKVRDYGFFDGNDDLAMHR